MKYPVLV